MAQTLGANFSISEVKVCVLFRASRDSQEGVGTEDKATSPRKGLPGKADHGVLGAVSNTYLPSLTDVPVLF
jgi:hypothetical protein